MILIRIATVTQQGIGFILSCDIVVLKPMRGVSERKDPFRSFASHWTDEGGPTQALVSKATSSNCGCV